MDKASASGAGDSRFESWAGHSFVFTYNMQCVPQSMLAHTNARSFQVQVLGGLLPGLVLVKTFPLFHCLQFQNQRPCCLMDKALVFGTNDCRFDSRHGVIDAQAMFMMYVH